jgi:hypothetical protein
MPNSTENGKLEKSLDGILDRIAGLIGHHSDNVNHPLLRLFEPELDVLQSDVLGPSLLRDLSPEAILTVAETLQQAATKSGEQMTVSVRLTQAEGNALAAHLPLEKSLAARLQAAAETFQPLTLSFVELLKFGLALVPEIETVRGKDAEQLRSAVGKIADSTEKLFAQVSRPKSPKKQAAKKARPSLAKDTVYQLKITLKHTDPPVWRRLLTKDCSLARLHEIIQLSMGWKFSHLFAFEVGGERYTEAFDGMYDADEQPASRQRLSRLYEQGVKSFRYVYDFGDDWEHMIKLEKTLPAESKLKYPRCVEGARACPPEDSGGVWGYERMLEILDDPKDPEYKEMREWLGGSFDPERFNLAQVNKQLAELRKS